MTFGARNTPCLHTDRSSSGRRSSLPPCATARPRTRPGAGSSPRRVVHESTRPGAPSPSGPCRPRRRVAWRARPVRSLGELLQPERPDGCEGLLLGGAVGLGLTNLARQHDDELAADVLAGLRLCHIPSKPCFQGGVNIVSNKSPELWLRERAESYWRDSQVLDADGDSKMAVAYRAIADELRKCAAQLPKETP